MSATLSWHRLSNRGIAPLLAASVIIAFPLGDAEAQPRRGGPPPEAFKACAGLKANDACTIRAPHGRIQGQCISRGDRPFCVPQSGPRGGPRGGPGREPGGAAGNRPQRGQGGGGSRFGYTEGAPFAGARPVQGRLTDTGQGTCFDERGVIECPGPGQAFYGQDAHYRGRPFDFIDNRDGTVTDRNTGLIWQKAHNTERKTFNSAAWACSRLDLGGHKDWRLPNIKEQFSIADFRGSQGRRFFIDAKAFDIELPDQSILRGDRFAATHRVEMMGQTWSSTIYKGSHWDRDNVEAAFFFNYFDGHIKQAPTEGRNSLFYRCVRGATWGANKFKDNGDGTVSDAASGLIWQRADDGKARDWKASLAYCEGLKLAGQGDWRLPNVKELQHIVDYSRHDPAIDPEYFKQTDAKGWFWSSTTHGDNIRMASYVCFGKCVSVDGVDVHGAGAQRADPKTGDPSQYTSLGGQQDQVRIQNYARCVRDDR